VMARGGARREDGRAMTTRRMLVATFAAVVVAMLALVSAAWAAVISNSGFQMQAVTEQG
jgi:hypothetical protein